MAFVEGSTAAAAVAVVDVAPVVVVVVALPLENAENSPPPLFPRVSGRYTGTYARMSKNFCG